MNRKRVEAKTSDIEETLKLAIKSSSFGKVQRLLSDFKENGNTLSNLISKVGSYELLRDAVRTKRIEIAKLLLRKGAEVNYPVEKSHSTVLHFAVFNQDLELIDMLIEKKINVNIKNSQGKTALHLAVEIGNEMLVKLLLTNGSEVNTVANDGSSPVRAAIKTIQKKNIFTLLVNYGADVNSLLYDAVFNGCLTIVDYLLKNYSFDTEKNLLCLPTAVLKIRFGKIQYQLISDLLFNHGFKADSSYKDNAEFFHAIIVRGYYRIIVDLLKLNVNINNLIDPHNQDTLLNKACKCNQLEIAKLLINYGADLNDKNCDSFNPIYYSITHNNLEMFNLLLQSGAHISKDDMNLINEAVYICNFTMVKTLITYGFPLDQKNEFGVTLLHMPFLKIHKTSTKNCLIDSDRESIVELLLSLGLDVNAQMVDNKSVLHVAVISNCKPIVEKLLKHNANVNLVNNEGWTPLFFAVKNNHYEITQLLINYNADVNLPNSNKVTPLHAAIVNKYEKIVEILLENNADPNSRYLEVKDTPLHMSIKHCYDKITGMLLKFNANVNLQNFHGSTPLHLAVKNNNLDIVKKLLENNADVNIMDKCRKTPLYFATKNGHLGIIKAILDRKPELPSMYEFKTTVLHYAARTGNYLDIIDYLANNPNDINTLNENGSSALHIGVENSFFGVVEYLLDNNADIDLTNERGQHCIHIAVECGSSEEVVQILVARTANINSIDKNGSTPLMIAAERNNSSLVSLLLSWGANVNLRNYAGDTALHLATKIDRKDIISQLLHYGADINVENKNKPALFNVVESLKRNRRLLQSNIKDNFDILIIFYEHIKKLQAANLYISFKNLRVIKLFKHLLDNLLVNERMLINYDDDHIDRVINSEESVDANSLIDNNSTNTLEVENMKSRMIGNSSISYYYFLTRNLHKVSKSICNKEIFNTLSTNDCTILFPIYFNLVYSKFRAAQIRYKLLKHSDVYIFQKGIFTTLPYNCIDRIKSFISNEDLVKIWFYTSRHY